VKRAREKHPDQEPDAVRANFATTLCRAPRLFVGVLLLQGGAALAQAPGESSAVLPKDCNRACLIGFLDSYMDALAHKDPGRARFASHVRFTENDVELPVGSGLWGSVSSVA
jgi:hypothetical protein